MIKFCHYLTKPIITRIIVSLMFKNVIIRIEVTVFRDFITLVFRGFITKVIKSLKTIISILIITFSNTKDTIIRVIMGLVKQ